MIPQEAIEKSIAGGWDACDIGKKWKIVMYRDAVELLDPKWGGCLLSMDEIACDEGFWDGLVKGLGLSTEPSELQKNFKAFVMLSDKTEKFWREVLD